LQPSRRGIRSKLPSSPLVALSVLPVVPQRNQGLPHFAFVVAFAFGAETPHFVLALATTVLNPNLSQRYLITAFREYTAKPTR
jgi:hypothetical protein